MSQPPPGMTDPSDRLDYYRAHRIKEANEKEEALVSAALSVPAGERSETEELIIGYSPLGTGQGCGC